MPLLQNQIDPSFLQDAQQLNAAAIPAGTNVPRNNKSLRESADSGGLLYFMVLEQIVRKRFPELQDMADGTIATTLQTQWLQNKQKQIANAKKRGREGKSTAPKFLLENLKRSEE